MRIPDIQSLPISQILGELRDELSRADEAVLEAPPGAGKTTVVPLALLDESWLQGQRIVMLEPRRVAARACATRMAQLLGETVGETVGYRIRQESRVSDATRIEVITEGILTRRLQSDPELTGVGLLIFDEFHERSLDSDLGLALALQARELFREGLPLKLLVMSATLDGEAISQLLGKAAVVSSAGRQFPVERSYEGSPPRNQPIAGAVATVVREALTQQPGNVLVFLPGQREINAVARELRQPLEGFSPTVNIVPLHGGLKLEEQQRAIDPPPASQRKVVLATNIAETSLTIAGITTVVDSGLVREARFDPLTGTTRLLTSQISKASAEQRCGRAGRLAPGHCYRLWSQEQQGRLIAHSAPEILQADLAPLAIQLLAWGEPDPAGLSWLDRPPAAAYQQALDLLVSLQAAQGDSTDTMALTGHGKKMATLPLHPRLAHMLIRGNELGQLQLAADLAALLSDRNPLGGAGVDLHAALRLLSGEDKCPGQYRGWLQRAKQSARRLRGLLPPTNNRGLAATVDRADITGLLVAMAYPDRIARQRAARDGSFQLSNGRSAALPASDALVHSQWLSVADLGGEQGSSVDRIYAAVALNPALFDSQLSELVIAAPHVAWDDREGKLLAEQRRSVGRIVLSRKAMQQLSAQQREQALLQVVRTRGLDIFRWTEELTQWRARVMLLAATLGDPWPDLSDEALLATAEQWLAPYLGKVRRLQDFSALDVAAMLANLLPWPLPAELDKLAPEKLQVPSGSRITIDYTQSPPVLAVKLQEMFGCHETPTVVGGRVGLLLHLLSPARRPLQVTQDLAGFWRGSYEAVKKDMKGRYPKHPWPDDPASAVATRHTKNRMKAR
jgi:ATP-dependent RNA helicase HrpB